MSLNCPKCGSEMRSYERNRVLVDQCVSCGGLFLDRGELEQLSAAENAWHSQQQQRPGQHDDQPRYDDRSRYDTGQQQTYHKKKKHSFLSELFD